MYAMELITSNDNIDNEIKNLYNKLVIENDDKKREKSLDSLDFYKGVRTSIEEVIQKVLTITEAGRLKKTVRRSLVVVVGMLSTKLSSCQAGCGGGGCDS